MKGITKIRTAPGEALVEMVSDRGSTPLASTRRLGQNRCRAEKPSIYAA